MAKKRSSKASDNSTGPAASFKNEVILWAVLAVSIILFISNFGIAGAAGSFISSIFFGLFGLSAYIFPILLFAGTAFFIANQENTTAMIKEMAALGFFIFFCMLLELVSGNRDVPSPLASYVWSAEHRIGGGLLGGLFTWLIRPHLGAVSAYIIDIVMLIICIVLMTQRSLWKPIQSGSRKVYASAKNETIRQRQQFQDRRKRRIDNKVSGVSIDTSIKNNAAPGASDNVSEIKPDPAFVQDFPIYMMNQPLPKPQSEPVARQSQYEQQEEQPQQILPQQNLAAAGMGYTQMPAFPADKIIPIKNRKVALKPSESTDAKGHASEVSANPEELFSELLADTVKSIKGATGSGQSEQTGAAQAGMADGVYDTAEPTQTDLFSGIYESAGQKPDFMDGVYETSGQMQPDAVAGRYESTGQMQPDLTDGIFEVSEQIQPVLADDVPGAAGNEMLDLSDSTFASADGLLQEAAVQAGIPNDMQRSAQAEAASVIEWNIVPDTLFGSTSSPQDAEPFKADVADFEKEEEEVPDLAPVSAQELIAQQLAAAAPAPKRVSAAAPVAASQQETGSTQHTGAESAAAASRQRSEVLQRQPKQTAAQAAAGAADVQMQLAQTPPKIKREYILPPVDLLHFDNTAKTGDTREHLQETALKLQQTLKNFGVNVSILNVSCGPSVTRYEIQPEMGVKVSKIVNLADDIKLNLAAADIRIEAPIPGKAAIGIEVPNKETVPVMFRDLIESEAFQKQSSPCAFAAGKDIAGQVVVTDICKMPHLLIAGATGSGKSVCINTIIMSIIYKANPDDVKLIMIDPKVVELSVYNGIPHLLLPVVTDPKKAAGALHWAVSEMMDRYQKFADYGVRDMKGYNAKVKKIADIPDEDKPQKMPYIVIIVDELADLMMAAPADVEDAICRLAQLARAAGIHLIIATQRPSVNVITGLIKANMPSRIAFSVTSGIDSRTILDMNGAEKLLGKGDMLFYPQGYQKPVRVQGAFVSDTEVSDVVEFLTQKNGACAYSPEVAKQVESAAAGGSSEDVSSQDERDVYFADAAKLLIDKEKASVSMLQRYFKIGFNRAARIMDQLEEAGVVGPEEGTKPRKIMMSPEQFAQYEEEVL